MAKLTIKKDPIAEMLNQQAIENFNAQRQQFQQSLPHYAPELSLYLEDRPVAGGMNAMRDWLMPYVRNTPFLYQPTDLPTNAMLLGAHPMASDAFRGPPEEPPRFYGYYGGTASYRY